MSNSPSNEFESRKLKVQTANQEMHTKLAPTYNKDEPHWRPENIERVTEILTSIADKAGRNRLLDLGCGTGFMIQIAKKIGFKEIYGVDITPAMVEQIDRSGSSKITVDLCDTSAIKHPDNYFDVATAYTFISHLDELGGTFKQAYRCLKPGGIFYSDLDPNASFWQEMSHLDGSPDSYHPFIGREVRHTTNNDIQLEEKYGIPRETYNMAEFQKAQTNGIREEDLLSTLKAIGFKNIQIKYKWFVGQGLIWNDSSLTLNERQSRIAIIEDYLQAAMPLSKSLYKYISFIATK